MNLYEVAGWIGAAIVVGAYGIVTRWGTSLLYHVLNVVGAAGLLVNALHHSALPSSAVNIVWMMIGVWGVVRMGTRASPRPGGG